MTSGAQDFPSSPTTRTRVVRESARKVSTGLKAGSPAHTPAMCPGKAGGVGTRLPLTADSCGFQLLEVQSAQVSGDRAGHRGTLASQQRPPSWTSSEQTFRGLKRTVSA